ncbi:MAG: DNA-binding protein [Clostridia bacterium]|nr:DNA-binding protein [Clostridia bacterium]
MKYRVFDGQIVAVLTEGDDIHGCIGEICRRENVRMGAVLGIGAASRLKVGVWNFAKDAYDTLEKSGESMELTSLTGNICMSDGEVSAHLHATAVDASFTAFGGHLIEGTAGIVVELYIYPGQGEINRVPYRSWRFMELE